MDRLRWIVAGTATLIALACSSPVELYIMSDVRKKVGEDWMSVAGGCVLAVSPHVAQSSATTGTVEQSADGRTVVIDDFIVEEHYDGETVDVIVSSGGDVVAERQYDAAFLATGEVDVIEVTTKRGHQCELKFWGGPTCDTSPLRDDAD